MADSVRAIGWELQTVLDTAVTVTNRANYVEAFTWDPTITVVIPHYQSGNRNQETRTRRTTKRDVINITQGNPDLYEFVRLLTACMGVPVATVFKMGTALRTVAGNFLSLKLMTGLAESWAFKNGRVNKISLSVDGASGAAQYTAEVFCVRQASQPGGTWTPGVSVPGGDMPMDPWQVVVLKGGAAPPGGCVFSIKLDLDNQFKELYCLPVTPPIISTEPGLAPTAYKDGVPMVRVALVCEYTGYDPSGFKDFLTHTLGAWTVALIDPSGATTPGSLTFSLPQLDWISGSHLDWSQEETRFIGTGAALLDSGTATSLSATLVLPV